MEAVDASAKQDVASKSFFIRNSKIKN
jgi:hypothetical protein